MQVTQIIDGEDQIHELWEGTSYQLAFKICAWINVFLIVVLLIDHTINNIYLNVLEYRKRREKMLERINNKNTSVNDQFGISAAENIWHVLRITVFENVFIFLTAILGCAITGVMIPSWLAPCLFIPVLENKILKYVI